MTLSVVLRPEAQSDLLSARDWYEEQRIGLGDDFIGAAEEVFLRIAETPELYAAALKGVRRTKLHRFPYVVYYRTLAGLIEVIGVLHGSRDPQIWQDRA